MQFIIENIKKRQVLKNIPNFIATSSSVFSQFYSSTG